MVWGSLRPGAGVSASHARPGSVIPVIDATDWLSFLIYLFSTVGFSAGGTLGLAPGSPKALCCPGISWSRATLVGWSDYPPWEMPQAPYDSCLLQEVPTWTEKRL